MFESLLAIVSAPVKVGMAVGGAVLKPVADLANEIVEEVEDACK